MLVPQLVEHLGLTDVVVNIQLLFKHPNPVNFPKPQTNKTVLVTKILISHIYKLFYQITDLCSYLEESRSSVYILE